MIWKKLDSAGMSVSFRWSRNECFIFNVLFICSKFLVAPDEDESKWQYSSDEMMDDDDNNSSEAHRENLVDILSTNEVSEMSGKKFRPGQLECPMVFFKRFPLHWRLQPKSALNILANDVLRPFAVKNRANMFVIQTHQCWGH